MQHGSIIQATRKQGPDVWQFRCSDKDPRPIPPHPGRHNPHWNVQFTWSATAKTRCRLFGSGSYSQMEVRSSVVAIGRHSSTEIRVGPSKGVSLAGPFSTVILVR